MRILIIIIFFLLYTLSSQAQLRCTTEAYPQQLQKDDISLSKKQEQLAGIPASITIPVVVHILYNTTQQNISDAQVQSQIEVLNNDFGKRNADINKVPAAFKGFAADTKIQFALATSDPTGNATNGIIRKNTGRISWKQDDQMKFNIYGGDDAWDAGSYLNIWVCNLDKSLLGYASFPGTPAERDGVVIRSDVFGTINIEHPVYNKGRTTTHEVGHWLNLKHLWGNSDCGDDEVADTPPQKNYNTGCSTFPKISSGSCNNSANGEMFMNFMDFSDDACIVMFTEGQALRMRALFADEGSRASILQSNGLTPGMRFEETETTVRDLMISPNPASQSISFLTKEGQPCSVDHYLLTDYTGKKLLQGVHRSTLDIYRLPPGIYLLRIEVKGQLVVRKLVKQ